MADQTSFAQPPDSTLPGQDEAKQEMPAPSAPTAAHKRKRDASDQDESAAGRGGDGDGARRPSFKRVSPSNAAPASDEAATESFISADNAGDDEPPSSSAPSLDFAALAQQHGGEPASRQNGTTDTSDATSTAAAALAGIFPTMTVPQPTDLSFASTASAGDGDTSFGMGDGDNPGGQNFDMDGLGRDGQPHSGRDSSGGQKPQVGSEEWHRVRRDNHKEVERRRRETINEGINELAKIVPGCEKNKGSILQRAVAFITQLKENEAQNIEKWTLEKLLTEQAIAELSASVDKLKNECERAWREAETWKKTCQSAGLTARADDASTGGGSGKAES
ncbi:MAG: basic helix-loop-helix protein [Thelocarpon impressellum]|nr:MAG: basic helix-loop-helix protein [Thelocarpon impressellum]